MSLIGVHIDNINELEDILENNPVYGQIKLVQTFVNATTNYKDIKYKRIKSYMKTKNIKLVVHASYSINLARRWTDIDWWIQQFIGEIIASDELDAFGIVVHTGKKLELSDAESINNMYTSLLHVHDKTKNISHVKIFIETPSGQGSEMLTKLEDLCRFLNKFYRHPDKKINERFAMCLDTCHVFASGYDIRTTENMNNVVDIINKSIGIDKIKLCHINDSKKGLGSKLDRHENIGDGEIKKEAIIRFVTFMNELEVPMILETPSKNVDKDYELLTK